MISTQEFKAVVNLNNLPEEVEHLKRLSLIFDEVYYIRPRLYVIEKTVIEDHTGVFQVDFCQDCIPFTVITQDNLQETLSAFEQAGIVKSISSSDYIQDDIRREIAIIDAADPEFVKVSQTSNTPSPAMRFKARGDDGVEREYTAISPPNALTDSFTLTNTLYVANRKSLFPVFLNSRHRQELQYRCNQYKQQVSGAKSIIQDVVSPESFETRFGEITFKLFNNIFAHELIIKKKPEEIVEYRNNMALARKRYLASLMDLAAIANDPWSKKAEEEIRKYIVKLDVDLMVYKQESENVCGKMFDDLKVLCTDATLWGLAGAVGTGGLSALFAPGVSPLDLLIVGSLTAMAKTGSRLYKTFLDFRREQKNLTNSALAYIAEFK